MESPLLKSCFICGLATFIANLMISFIFPPGLILSTCLLPGFLFGLVIAAHERQSALFSKIVFLAISSGLYILVAWMPTGHDFFWQQYGFTVVLASMLGAVGLLLAYYLLLNKHLILRKGLFLATLSGLFSALPPFVTFALEGRLLGWHWLQMAGIFSIFLSWQALFGWVVQTVAFRQDSPLSY